jgi:hypothetical protein
MKPSGFVQRTTKIGGRRSVYMKRSFAGLVPIFIQGIWTTTFFIQIFCIGSSSSDHSLMRMLGSVPILNI